jgi:hypothetical protein
VNYTLTATNTGDENLTNAAITDDWLVNFSGEVSVSLKRGGESETPLTAGTDYTFTPSEGKLDGFKVPGTGEGLLLAPGDQIIVRYGKTLGTVGSHTNTAEARAEGELSGEPLDDDDEVTVTVEEPPPPPPPPPDPEPGIDLDKSATPTGALRPGVTVNYTLTATHTGDENLKNVTITDDWLKGTVSNLTVTLKRNGGGETALTQGTDYTFTPSEGRLDGFKVPGTNGVTTLILAPGDQIIVRYSKTLSTVGSHTNTAEARADGELSGKPVTDDDNVTVTVTNPPDGPTPDPPQSPEEPPKPPEEPPKPPEEPPAEPPEEPPAPPAPNYPGNELVPNENGGYLEIGPDGTPLGEWRQDPETGEWIFDEFTPLATLPQTGGVLPEDGPQQSGFPLSVIMALLALVGIGFGHKTIANKKNSAK